MTGYNAEWAEARPHVAGPSADAFCPTQRELNLKTTRRGKAMENEMSPDAERAGMLAALHAIVVGTLSTLKRKGVLTPQDIDQLFDAGLSVFERGEPDDTKAAARLTLEILARSLRD
jgi:hypothetical protein